MNRYRNMDNYLGIRTGIGVLDTGPMWQLSIA